MKEVEQAIRLLMSKGMSLDKATATAVLLAGETDIIPNSQMVAFGEQAIAARRKIRSEMAFREN